MRTGVTPRRYHTGTDSALGRIRRGVASWLGLILLIANITGASSMPTTQVEAGTAPFVQDLLGDRIVVCTAAGMVVLDRDGRQIPSDGTGGHTDFCVFCLPLMHGGIDAPAAVAVIEIPTAPDVASAIPTESSQPVPVRLAGAASPRAPPLS